MYQAMTMEPRRISKKGLKNRKLSTGTVLKEQLTIEII